MAEIKRYHEMPEALHIGCEEPAAYFIPFESEEKSSAKRENSAFFTSLCGEWKFGWYENIARLEIESPDFPASMECRDDITVPGCWQLYTDRGYDAPNYINQDYPYPVDPPYLPDVIPCGLYRRSISLSPKADKSYYLSFEGVASCFYLWVNSRFLAYSQVSHSTSVVDITAAVHDGENTIEVLVVKHCTGSYFEDQDFFRLSGIFREVYITERDRKHISDIELKTEVAETLDRASLSAEIKGVEAFDYKLISPDGVTISEGKNTLDINLENPVLWNYEKPRLYTLILHSGSEYISLPVGFKRFEIKDSTVLLNGKKVKAKGINRHDSNPETGYWVTEEQMLAELYSLKRANVNTIRTSHYPNDPRFLALCDSLGFMVVDEADLETHGMGYNFGDWYWDFWAHLTDAPEYRENCVDRARLLYERDKNHPCVIMWSLGNESGCGENHRAMAQYIRSRNKNNIIHYENAHLEYEARLGKDFGDISDVESRMYASTDYLKEYLADESRKKPFFYCEYVDSMSTGEIGKHWDGFEDNDKYFGGCVWEYCDHAVNIGTKENPEYRYGGDFGDWPNDNICCVDGLVHPDRTPRPGYYDMKKAYEPFRITYLGKGRISLFNKLFFSDFSGYEIQCSIERNGIIIRDKSLVNTDIPPRESRGYSLFDESEIPSDGLVTLNIHILQKTATPWAEKAYEAGFAQFIISDENPVCAKENKSPVEFTESRTDITVKCGTTVYDFDRITGRIARISTGTEKIPAEPLSFSLWRAVTYNTRGYIDTWKRARYDHIKQKTYGTEVFRDGENVVIKAKVAFASAAMPPAVRAEVIYTFTTDGGVEIKTDAKVTYNAPPLPRFGLSIVLPDSFDRFSYLGYGPSESYSDRYKADMLSLFETTPAEDYVHYVKPQECSSHYDCRYACVESDKARLEFFTDSSFCFRAIPYSDRDLHGTKHDDELPDTGKTYVSVDYKILASNQGKEGEYPEREFGEKEFTFGVKILPSAK